MAKAADVLRAGTRIAVRNGRNTKFWTDKWCEGGTLLEVAQKPIPEHDLHAWVEDYWDAEKGWNWNVLTNMLPAQSCSKLASKILTHDPKAEDTLCWGMEPSGHFSVKSTYSMLRPPSEEQNNGSWQAIRSIKVPNRICNFLWLIKHDRILTNAERCKRGLSPCEHCPHCHNKTEDLHHIFRTCLKAIHVWKKTLPGILEQDAIMPFSNWVDFNINKSNLVNEKERWNGRFAIIIWWLWKWRNNFVFNRKDRPYEEKIAWINRYGREVASAPVKKSKVGGILYQSKIIKLNWEKPPTGWVKINSDGCATRDNKHACCGGVMRNENGNWLCGYACEIGSSTEFEAEAWGILHGLRIAAKRGYRKIKVELDAKHVVQCLKG